MRSPLRPDQIEQAASLLATARRDVRVIDALPASCRPHSLADAYAIQASLVEHLASPVGGWFCACTNPVIQRMLGLAEPYYARVLADVIHASPATISQSRLPPIAIECEFAFSLTHDLPPRATPYTRQDVLNAVACVHPSIEVVAGHLRDWPSQDVFSVIADNGTDGALILGAGVDIDLTVLPSTTVTLRVNDDIACRGTGANVLGDPVAALVWLANARARDGHGLKAGQVHNTGTCTDIYWANVNDRLEAQFEGLGAVRLRIAP